jgi:hypothetical protein
MIEILESRSVDLPRRRALARALARARWCWPAEAAGWSFEHAARLVPSGPPGITPGEVLLVTANEDCASLWVLLCHDLPPDEETRSFGKRAEGRWKDAAAALPRSLPLLWAPVAEARRAPHAALHLWSRPRLHREARPETVLDGPSFGLAFVLSLASRVLGARTPEDVVASACVGPDGRLEPAGEIAEKVDVVWRAAPRVRRLLIAATRDGAHAREAKRAAVGTAIEIHAVSSATAALRLVFGDGLASLLIGAGSDAARRRELVDSLFRLALSGRNQVLDWTPVQAAAARARQAWEGQLDEDEKRQLEFAEAVAARHESNAGVLPVPEEKWLQQMPVAVRVGLLANFVQHSADTATPPAEAIEALAEPYRAPAHESFPVQLKLMGALGRLHAVTGRAAQALPMQEQAAVAFFGQLEYAEVSFPLTEWYRLAGVSGDQQAFDRAERLHERVEERGGLGFSWATCPSTSTSKRFVGDDHGCRHERVELGDLGSARSVLVNVLCHDQLEHRLVTQAAFRPLLAELLDEFGVQQDRGWPQGSAKDNRAARCLDVVAQVALFELRQLRIFTPDHRPLLALAGGFLIFAGGSLLHMFASPSASWAGS